MPNGGNLHIACSNLSLDDSQIHDFEDLPSGDYVMLAISDDGAGMSAEVRSHAFEPFFTTKEWNWYCLGQRLRTEDILGFRSRVILA